MADADGQVTHQTLIVHYECVRVIVWESMLINIYRRVAFINVFVSSVNLALFAS